MKLCSTLGLSAAAACLSALLATAPATASTLITFDDLSDVSAPAQIPAGYEGMTWSANFYYVNGNFFIPSGYNNGTVTSPNVAFNVFGQSPVDFGDAAAFTLNSLYLTPAWNDGEQVTITGLLNGTQEFQTVVTLNSEAANLITLNWSGINDVSFLVSGGTNVGYGGSGEFIALDNILLNETEVPEPITISLFGAGLVGAAAMRRSKKKIA